MFSLYRGDTQGQADRQTDTRKPVCEILQLFIRNALKIKICKYTVHPVCLQVKT